LHRLYDGVEVPVFEAGPYLEPLHVRSPALLPWLRPVGIERLLNFPERPCVAIKGGFGLALIPQAKADAAGGPGLREVQHLRVSPTAGAGEENSAPPEVPLRITDRCGHGGPPKRVTPQH
jgi:hypothetical protein